MFRSSRIINYMFLQLLNLAVKDKMCGCHWNCQGWAVISRGFPELLFFSKMLEMQSSTYWNGAVLNVKNISTIFNFETRDCTMVIWQIYFIFLFIDNTLIWQLMISSAQFCLACTQRFCNEKLINKKIKIDKCVCFSRGQWIALLWYVV